MYRLLAGLCLPGAYNPSPVENFDFITDMNITGGWLLFFHFTVCPTGSLSCQSQHKELAMVSSALLSPSQ